MHVRQLIDEVVEICALVSFSVLHFGLMGATSSVLLTGGMNSITKPINKCLSCSVSGGAFIHSVFGYVHFSHGVVVLSLDRRKGFIEHVSCHF